MKRIFLRFIFQFFAGLRWVDVLLAVSVLPCIAALKRFVLGNARDMSGNELVRIDTNILPKAKLIVVFCGLAFALLVSFIDQNSIGIALPTIGADWHAATTISWAGTSSLIANTVFQVLYRRLSDSECSSSINHLFQMYRELLLLFRHVSRVNKLSQIPNSFLVRQC